MEIVVLRYGHRHVRDARTTTHCCLVARAFGAKKIIIDGEEDKKILETIEKICKKWGNGFETSFVSSWKKTLEEYKKQEYTAVHLTMYGLPLQKEIKKIQVYKKIIVIIGSQKVEPDVYKQADYNISITGQPHSEIAALAVFLNDLVQRKTKEFLGAKIKITPSPGKKRVMKS